MAKYFIIDSNNDDINGNIHIVEVKEFSDGTIVYNSCQSQLTKKHLGYQVSEKTNVDTVEKWFKNYSEDLQCNYCISNPCSTEVYRKKLSR